MDIELRNMILLDRITKKFQSVRITKKEGVMPPK